MKYERFIEFFVRTTALAYENLAKQFADQEAPEMVRSLESNERTLLRFLNENQRPVKPKELAQLFQVNARTISNWSKRWIEKGLIERAWETKRITPYQIGRDYAELTLADLGYQD